MGMEKDMTSKGGKRVKEGSSKYFGWVVHFRTIVFI